VVRGRRGDALAAFAVALVARLAVVAWAHGRFPAVEDGHYYDVLARRLAEGHGYTWLWPDGAVTYAAHYPVGYPSLLALAYGALGASAGVAMLVNAIVGALAAWGAHAMVDGEGVARWRPLAAGLVVALHPALVPYTAAVMTEGVTAALVVAAAGMAARARGGGRAWVAAVGLTMGVAVLVRPQSLLLAPVIGVLAVGAGAGWRARTARAIGVTVLALAVVAPWTARNCVRMHRCAMVSVNGGWNLLIGAHTTTGGWAAVDVPEECRTVWDEAGKDACFEAAARREIAGAPLAFVERVPGKLAATLDYFGAAPWYLHASDAQAFDDAAKWKLGAIETVVSRLLLLAALVAVGRLGGPRLVARKTIALAGAVAGVTQHGWIGYVLLALALALLGRRVLARGPLVLPATLAAIAATVAVHAVFFGAGRYGLVVAPFVASLAVFALPAVSAKAARARGIPMPPEASASCASSASTESDSRSAAARS
jgi:hypothetical protein